MEAVLENGRCFRSHLASKKYNYDDFICKGDLESWVNVFRILNGMFYKNNISSYKIKSSIMEYTIFEIYIQNLIEITKSLK